MTGSRIALATPPSCRACRHAWMKVAAAASRDAACARVAFVTTTTARSIGKRTAAGSVGGSNRKPPGAREPDPHDGHSHSDPVPRVLARSSSQRPTSRSHSPAISPDRVPSPDAIDINISLPRNGHRFPRRPPRSRSLTRKRARSPADPPRPAARASPA